MGEKQIEILNAEEQDAIGKAVFLLVKECPAIPADIKVRYGDIADNTIGIFAQQSAVVTKRYINGIFTAQFPFVVLYRSKPTTDSDRIAREEVLTNIAKWLSGRKITINGSDYILKEYPQLSEGRKITGIEQLKTVALAGKLQDGSVDYTVDLRLDYKKREERNI